MPRESSRPTYPSPAVSMNSVSLDLQKRRIFKSFASGREQVPERFVVPESAGLVEDLQTAAPNHQAKPPGSE